MTHEHDASRPEDGTGTLTFAIVTFVAGGALLTSGILLSGQTELPVVAAGAGTLLASVGIGTALTARGTTSTDQSETDRSETETLAAAVAESAALACDDGTASPVTGEWDDDRHQAIARDVNRLVDSAVMARTEDPFQSEFAAFAAEFGAALDALDPAVREEGATARVDEEWTDESLQSLAMSVNTLLSHVEAVRDDIEAGGIEANGDDDRPTYAHEVAAIETEVETIVDAAEQTSMLALNAHIEASRAGDDGDRFSTVARDIKDLAERTQRAADTVESDLERLRRDMDDDTDTDAAAVEEADESEAVAAVEDGATVPN